MTHQASNKHTLSFLLASDRANNTIRRYRSAVEGFLAWYFREEQQMIDILVRDMSSHAII